MTDRLLKYTFWILCAMSLAGAAASAVHLANHFEAQATSSGGGGQMIPEPQNPYCCSIPLQFEPPEPVCPTDGYYQVDVVCEAICANAYKQTMVQVYNDACTRWSHSDQDYLNDCRVAIHAYDACAAHAHNLLQLEACRDNMIADFNTALNKLKARRADIDHDVANKKAAAEAAYLACAHNCCIWVGFRREKSPQEPPK